MNRLLLSIVLCAAAAQAAAQSFPSKPIRVIIPFVAGGSSDIVGRAIAAKFQDLLGQPGVVENRPGANGAIAAEFVAKADPDGHTILVGSIGVFSINAALFKDLRYHPVRDFAPITLAVTTPNVLITKPTLAAGSLKELVEAMKKNPGKLSYCSSGTGSSDHLTAELLKQASGTDAVHVPTRRRRVPDRHHGEPGGLFLPEPWCGHELHQGQPHEGAGGHRQGTPCAAARSAGGRRSGMPDLVVTSWQAAAAPAKTPREVVARLNEAMVKALRAPDISARMNQIGFDVVASSPEEFAAFMKGEVERWTGVVAKGNIKPE